MSTNPIDRIANDPNIDPAFRAALIRTSSFGLLRAAVALAVSVGPEHIDDAMACLRRALEESERKDNG